MNPFLEGRLQYLLGKFCPACRRDVRQAAPLFGGLHRNGNLPFWDFLAV